MSNLKIKQVDLHQAIRIAGMAQVESTINKTRIKGVELALNQALQCVELRVAGNFQLIPFANVQSVYVDVQASAAQSAAALSPQAASNSAELD